MRHIYLICLLSVTICLSSCTFINNLSINEYELTGRLINLNEIPSHCGYIAYAMPLEFEIIEFSDDNYNRDTVGVVLKCPRRYADGYLSNGSIYKMKLQDANTEEFGWSIMGWGILEEYGYEDYLWIEYFSLEKVE